MSMIEDIIKEAELELEKKANDQNGAPESASTSGGKNDIMTQANTFLQEVEQFKAQLGQQVTGNPPGNTEEIQPELDENGNPIDHAAVQDQPQASGGATIQTPGGTIIKLAGLTKLAAQHMKLNLEGVQ